MAVGKSYPPEFYDYIKNEKVRKVFYQIAEETEEDYQKLINLLNSFGVETVRPDISYEIDFANNCIKHNEIIPAPGKFMQPRDSTIMLGDTFYAPSCSWAENIVKNVRDNGNTIENTFPTGMKSGNFDIYMNSAMISRVGKDLIVGTVEDTSAAQLEKIKSIFTEKVKNRRIQVANTNGHTDGTFCPVVPGLILSIAGDYVNYKDTFPNWEVVFLLNESWNKITEWQQLKAVNRGKWWVPGEELNQDFTDYVETWMNHWVGYVEESVFDVNMIVIDKKNVIVNGYNRLAFDAFNRYGITPHICNFRHRYFWDGGLHCITSDLHREGVMEDYFPERGQ
jgi:N-dimethylarginine dimethylaminohydrolase